MASAALALFLALALLGCAPSARQASARAAQAVARVATAALPVAVDAYRAEGERAIEEAPSEAAARAELEAVRARWRPFWAAWERARLAQVTWSALLEAGAEDAALTAAAERLRRAYCEARAAVPALGLADVGGSPCPSR